MRWGRKFFLCDRKSLSLAPWITCFHHRAQWNPYYSSEINDEFCGTVKGLSEVFERRYGKGRNGNTKEIWLDNIFQLTIRVWCPFYFLKIRALPYTNDYSPPLRPFTPPIRKLFFYFFPLLNVFSWHGAIESSTCRQRNVLSFYKRSSSFSWFPFFHVCDQNSGNCRCLSKFWVSFDNSFFFKHTTFSCLLGFLLFYCRGYQNKKNNENKSQIRCFQQNPALYSTC